MTRCPRIEDLELLAVPSQPAVSPDGSTVVYVLRTHDLTGDRTVTRLWIVADGQAPRALTAGTDDRTPAWSPDGTRLAFVRGGELWAMPAAGGEAYQLAAGPVGCGAPVWSPDGSTIAFAADDPRWTDPAAPLSSDVIEYHADGRGWWAPGGRQIHVLGVSTGDVRQITDTATDPSDPSWSPDGSSIVYTARAAGRADTELSSAVHVVNLTGPSPRAVVAAFQDGIATSACFSEDGSRLITTGWTAERRGHERLFVTDLESRTVTELSAGLDRNVMLGAIAHPGAAPQVVGDDVYFCTRDRGCTHLYSVSLGGGEPRHVLGEEGQVVDGLSVAGDTLAVVVVTPESFGEVVTLDRPSARVTVRTRHGDALGDVRPIPRVPREFTISDGTRVQAWIVRAPSTTGPSPLLLDIHGGPHGAWNGAIDEVRLYHQELAAAGWTVLLVNPRGSDGYGEAFYDAVHAAWGEADMADFLEPIDQLVEDDLADPRRLAVTGYSYGGFMTCYLTAHDDRFAAAMAGGAVTDLFSMLGTSDEAHDLAIHELGGFPWRATDRPRLAALSPYTHVEQVTTPTLILHGMEDRRCPVGQAQQWHQALRERGVPTRLVLYPEGSHAFPYTGPPSQRVDYHRRVVDWARRHATTTGIPLPDIGEATHWERRVRVLARRHHVPGAQLGILRVGDTPDSDALLTASAGVLNAATGASVTTDALWQIGSITKVWTATVIMQLLDEGQLGLDTPVHELLPELRLCDEQAMRDLTVRHLLTHTSGIAGDVIADTGRGDDCLARYVATLAEVPMTHPLGAMWSYCNAGFVILGRMIETLTGQTWDQAMRERVFEPLGLRRTATLAEDVMVFPHATGHVVGLPDPVLAPVSQLPRSLGPAGLISIDIQDLLAFARLHLTGGLTPDGTRLLSEHSVLAMTSHQVDCPETSPYGDSMGLAWFRADWGGHRVYGHDGATIGQTAFLRVLPDDGLAIALLTNGGNAQELAQDLFDELAQTALGVSLSAAPQAAKTSVEVDAAPFLGTYERESLHLEISCVDGTMMMRAITTGPLAEVDPEPVKDFRLESVATNLFIARRAGDPSRQLVSFTRLGDGERYVYLGSRAAHRA